MMTTKKLHRSPYHLVVVAAVATFLTACGPPGARQLKRGERDIQAGNSGDAILELEDAVRILGNAPHPVQAKAWNLLGIACQDAGRPDDAAKAYMMALKLDPNNPAMDYNLGCLQIQRTNFPGAINYLTSYSTLRPADVQGYLRLGTARFHSALEQRNAAERNRLLELARRDFQNADKVELSAESANSVGMIELQHRPASIESIRAAAKEFTVALQRDSHYGPALLNLAILSQQYLNQPAQALKLYRQYLTLNPPPPHATEVEKLAQDLDMKQRIIITPGAAPSRAPTTSQAPPPGKMAIVPSTPAPVTQKPPPADSRSGQAAAPIPAPARFSAAPQPAQVPPPAQVPASGEAAPPPATVPPAGTVPEQAHVSTSNSAAHPANETPSSANASESAPEPVVPDTASPHRKTITQRLNPLNWFSSKSKNSGTAAEPPPLPAGSRFEYPPAVTPIPGDRARAKRLVAEAIQAKQAGDGTESIRIYKEAETADPTFYDASYGLGLAELNARDYPTALEALHRALELQEDSAEARYAFAWALQRRGYTEDAVHELSKLVEQHPNEARGHLLLGNLYAEKLHQPKLAREQFLLTLELDPNNAQAETIRDWLKKNP
jgi:tetratricopeptide (TPR) repeat protein